LSSSCEECFFVGRLCAKQEILKSRDLIPRSENSLWLFFFSVWQYICPRHHIKASSEAILHSCLRHRTSASTLRSGISQARDGHLTEPSCEASPSEYGPHLPSIGRFVRTSHFIYCLIIDILAQRHSSTASSDNRSGRIDRCGVKRCIAYMESWTLRQRGCVGRTVEKKGTALLGNQDVGLLDEGAHSMPRIEARLSVRLLRENTWVISIRTVYLCVLHVVQRSSGPL